MAIPLEILEELPVYRREFIQFARRYKGTMRIRETVAHYTFTPSEINQIREWLEKYGTLKMSELKEINHAKAMA